MSTQPAIFSGQTGSVSVMMLFYVSIVVLLLAGLTGLGEWNMAHTRVQLAAQASANSGAFQYGKSWIKEMKVCIKTEIEERLSDTQDELLAACVADGLPECLASDFEQCELDLSTCWDEADSPISMCEGDVEVKQAALDQANAAARRIIGSYTGVEFDSSLHSDQDFSVTVHKEQRSVIPVWGKSGRIDATAKSKVIIRE